MITYYKFDDDLISYFISTPTAVARIDLHKHDSSQVYSHNDYSDSFIIRYPEEATNILPDSYRLITALFEDCYIG